MSQTRIEQIRAMSDEELATFILEVSGDDTCPCFCKYKEDEGCARHCDFKKDCIPGILAYLQSHGKPDDHLTPPLAEQPRMYDDQEDYVPGLDYYGRPVK